MIQSIIDTANTPLIFNAAWRSASRVLVDIEGRMKLLTEEGRGLYPLWLPENELVAFMGPHVTIFALRRSMGVNHLDFLES